MPPPTTSHSPPPAPIQYRPTPPIVFAVVEVSSSRNTTIKTPFRLHFACRPPSDSSESSPPHNIPPNRVFNSWPEYKVGHDTPPYILNFGVESETDRTETGGIYARCIVSAWTETREEAQAYAETRREDVIKEKRETGEYVDVQRSGSWTGLPLKRLCLRGTGKYGILFTYWYVSDVQVKDAGTGKGEDETKISKVDKDEQNETP
ncbi:hypothetical protein K505DRAFT_361144 [Melanomma pulvis-pyrius CBS 109.77]|uniref:Uncharacterized protein n=1 Tax=Melanomma pulvis-pyrius CBS 109.77 TaxID=1314802 RepID=A0A6A6XD49_9PLEO|nr:hypothetical protein K505DRAFT_361144 [Melanomma pulvis-pyrius CBS 109.77]